MEEFQKSHSASVSLIVPTLNAAWDLPRLLYRLDEQTLKPDEIIIVDSSSDDDTVEIAHSFGVKVAVIKREEFNHGITRHAALLVSRGDIVCFMTQDAVPADKYCIENLIRPFSDPSIGCSTGRQLPKRDASRFEQLIREFNYGSSSMVHTAADIPTLGIKTFFISDVCSAYRRVAFLECGGFPETDMSEDMYMAARMISNGWKVAYAADACVFHSHNLSFCEQYQRNKAIGVFLESYKDLLGCRDEIGEGKRLVFEVGKTLLHEKRIASLIHFGIDCTARVVGNRMGRASVSKKRIENSQATSLSNMDEKKYASQKSPRILINASILSSKNTGLGHYTYQVVSRVCPLLDEAGIQYDILCGSPDYLPKELRHSWKHAHSSSILSKTINDSLNAIRGYDLIWSTTQHGSVLPCPQVVTIHDLTPLKYPEGRRHQVVYYQYILPRIIKNCLGIITVSENTRKDIQHVYSDAISNRFNVRVIGAAADSLERLDEIEAVGVCNKYNVLPNCYFCITGIHYPYKNIQLVIEAASLGALPNGYKVVIIGNDSNEYAQFLKEEIAKYHLEDAFVFTGYIDKNEKIALIQSSEACIFPSKYEGFGLPVLEAMSLGVPLLCSNASSLPDVAGDAAIFFSPDDVSCLVQAMQTIIEDKEEAERLVRLGYENTLRFNWDTISHELASYLIELVC